MNSVVITGARKGIGRALAEHYLKQGWHVTGCSRGEASLKHQNYRHHCLDVSDESAVVALAHDVKQDLGSVDALINNAGIASMNHCLLTPGSTVTQILQTNVAGTFLLCREFAKLMRKRDRGRIINFTSVAQPLNLEGEAVYAASKAAVESLTRVMARELAELQITVNAVGPTPVETDLIKGVAAEKIQALIARQAIRRQGNMDDIINVVDFFLKPESDFITGQVIYLGGVT